jgi:DNA-binding MarR family transcriptional regulator
MSKLIKALAKRKAIKKATYSIVYHPLFLLSHTYIEAMGTSGKRRSEYKDLGDEHIMLLSYLMSYNSGTAGQESFWGSNDTIATDLGVSSRTIQRRLKVLADLGYITIHMENASDRYIYVNFTRIMDEILCRVDAKYRDARIDKACGMVVEYFIRTNHLERTLQEHYIQWLWMAFQQEVCDKEVVDVIGCLFRLLADELKVEEAAWHEDYLKVRKHYIDTMVNNCKM